MCVCVCVVLCFSLQFKLVKLQRSPEEKFQNYFACKFCRQINCILIIFKKICFGEEKKILLLIVFSDAKE